MNMKENPVIVNILQRRSVRSYGNDAIPKETLDTIAKCGIYAPTAWHKEPWAICIVQNSELLKRFDGECLQWIVKTQPSVAGLFSGEHGSVLYHAPAMILVGGDRDEPFAPTDCALAGQNMMLAAWSLGIGSCVIGFASEFLKSSDGSDWLKIFHMPADHNCSMAIIFGYASSSSHGSQRDASKILHV
jgi:nitroreductase